MDIETKAPAPFSELLAALDKGQILEVTQDYTESTISGVRTSLQRLFAPYGTRQAGLKFCKIPVDATTCLVYFIQPGQSGWAHYQIIVEAFASLRNWPLRDTGRNLSEFTEAELSARTLRSWKENYSKTPRVTSSGADPELFLVDDASGEMLPAFEMLPAKGRAIRTEYYSLYNDGFQAEFRINGTPPHCHEILTGHIGQALSRLNLEATRMNAHLSLKDMLPIPERARKDYKSHMALGCAPSLNAYGIKGLDVENPRELPIRFAGGHVHFGFGELRPTKEQYVETIKALDAVSGVMGVHMGHALCTPDRRQFYGMAGEYRLPVYGLEYRTLSPFWLCDPRTAYFTLDLARKVVNLKLAGSLNWKASEDQVQSCINSNNPGMAREILENNREELDYLLWSMYGSHVGKPEKISLFMERLLERGLSLFCKNPEALAVNWSFTSEGSYKLQNVRSFIGTRI